VKADGAGSVRQVRPGKQPAGSVQSLPQKRAGERAEVGSVKKPRLELTPAAGQVCDPGLRELLGHFSGPWSAEEERCAVCCVLCAVCCVLCAVCCVLCAVCCGPARIRTGLCAGHWDY
jgi:hypothetical protein